MYDFTNDINSIFLNVIAIGLPAYIICTILDRILDKKKKQKEVLPKSIMSREEIIQRERRRTRWARRKAKKHIKKDGI